MTPTTPRARCLVIEDDAQIRTVLRSLLANHGLEVIEAATAEDGLDLAEHEDLDLILCDISLPGMNGIDAVGGLHDAQPDAPVILVTAYPTIESAVKGMRAGAFDYVTKPFNSEELLMVVERALDHQALERENRALRHLAVDSQRFAGIVAESPAMRDIVSRIQRIAGSRSNVLITGESGVGKEVVARAVHQSGPNANEPFVAINCSAIAPNLLESELFGHRKGSFTGATEDTRGPFEAAGRGTIFLDEIGDLGLELQTKLLRVIQNREVLPVGATRAIPFKARIVAATNAKLRDAVSTGAFRTDLFYRLNVIPISIPPLRERNEDVGPLADFFLERHSGKPDRRLSPAARSVLMMHRWDGNARELENVIERALVLSDSPVIGPEELPIEEPSREEKTPELDRLFDVAADNKLSVRQLVDRYIARVLDQTGGNKAEAARRLNISVRTIYRQRDKTSPDLPGNAD